jgi:hypothetical protein
MMPGGEQRPDDRFQRPRINLLHVALFFLVHFCD